MRKFAGMFLTVLVLHAALLSDQAQAQTESPLQTQAPIPSPTQAQAQAVSQSARHADYFKSQATKFNDKHDTVRVHLKSEKHVGRINQIYESTFELKETKTGNLLNVNYADVVQLDRVPGFMERLGDWLAIGILIPILVGLVVLVCPLSYVITGQPCL